MFKTQIKLKYVSDHTCNIQIHGVDNSFDKSFDK